MRRKRSRKSVGVGQLGGGVDRRPVLPQIAVRQSGIEPAQARADDHAEFAGVVEADAQFDVGRSRGEARHRDRIGGRGSRQSAPSSASFSVSRPATVAWRKIAVAAACAAAVSSLILMDAARYRLPFAMRTMAFRPTAKVTSGAGASIYAKSRKGAGVSRISMTVVRRWHAYAAVAGAGGDRRPRAMLWPYNCGTVRMIGGCEHRSFEPFGRIRSFATCRRAEIAIALEPDIMANHSIVTSRAPKS